MTETLNKCRILYKGDVLASFFYILVAALFLSFSTWSYYWGTTPGFTYLSIGFFMFFLRKRAKTSWIVTLVMTAMASGFILGLAYALSLNFPYGYIQTVYDLPWPFR